MNKKPEIPFFQFPPYGIMNNSFLRILGSQNVLGSPTNPIVPPDFRPPKDPKGLQRNHHWIQLRDQLAAEMADVLWPVWNTESRSWKGRAVEHMLALTRVDLELLLPLRIGPGPLPLNSQPDSRGRTLNCPPHSAFFTEEDQGKIFNSYTFYDRDLDPKFPSIFGDTFFAGLDAKCSSTELQFKRLFQRPRPFQMAFLMGKHDFNLEKADSSMTPSMVSGHCLQGLIGVGAVMERIIQGRIPFSHDSWQALGQYAVDIGDRRVFAGIHYPSDNLSSWIVLMRLANQIYGSKATKKKLWNAITNQSLVYRLIRDSRAKVYSPGLGLLERTYKSE